MRIKVQDAVLDRAAALVKPGGRIAYATCSLLDEENGARLRTFLAQHRDFSIVPADDAMNALGPRKEPFRAAVRVTEEGLLMTPLRTGTDGFFVGCLRRAG